MKEADDKSSRENQRFAQSADISEPVKYAVNLALQSLQVQVNFVHNAHVHSVWEFEGPWAFLGYAEDFCGIVLRDWSKLKYCIL